MEAKKAEKEAEKERKKAEKEAEKEQKKAEKEAEKEAKKETTKKPVAKAIVPAKAVKPTETVEAKPVATKVVVTKADETKPVKPAPKSTPKKEEVIPDDGMVHPWTFEGKKYLRNADGETWSVGSDGGIGKWVGVYSSETKKIDTNASEPEFDDEE